MKNAILIITCLAALVITSPSCNPVEEEGTLQFGMELSDDPLLKSAFAENRISAALVTIKDLNGTLIFDKEYLPVYKFGEQYTTKTLKIPVGKFQLTEFMLIDTSGVVLWATPVEGSMLAHLVRNPLPLAFEVGANETTSLPLQVIRVADHSPADFGYVNFEIGFVERFCLQVFYFSRCMEEWNDSILGPTGQGAPIHQPRITIVAGDQLVLEEPLNQGLNRYRVPLVDRWYVVEATDCHGNQVYMRKFSVAELLTHNCAEPNNPLVINREDPGVLITPEGLREPTIGQGVFGSISIPVYDSVDIERYDVYPVVRDVYLFPYAVMDSLYTFAPMDCYFPREAIGMDPVAIVRSNSDGYFQVPLEVGEYLYLVKLGDRYYMDAYISSHRPGYVRVNPQEVTRIMIHVIDCSMWM